MGLKPRVGFRWDLSDPLTYPIIEIDATTPRRITAALSHWWAKIAELASRSEMFDTMVGDIWLDSGRIIGHVQMRDAAVGFDTGFRVAAHVAHVIERLQRSDYDDATWKKMTELLSRCATDALALEPAASTIAELRARQPFDIEITSFGQWPASAAG